MSTWQVIVGVVGHGVCSGSFATDSGNKDGDDKNGDIDEQDEPEELRRLILDFDITNLGRILLREIERICGKYFEKLSLNNHNYDGGVLELKPTVISR